MRLKPMTRKRGIASQDRRHGTWIARNKLVSTANTQHFIVIVERAARLPFLFFTLSVLFSFTHPRAAAAHHAAHTLSLTQTTLLFIVVFIPSSISQGTSYNYKAFMMPRTREWHLYKMTLFPLPIPDPPGPLLVRMKVLAHAVMSVSFFFWVRRTNRKSSQKEKPKTIQNTSQGWR